MKKTMALAALGALVITFAGVALGWPTAMTTGLSIIFGIGAALEGYNRGWLK